MSRRRGLIHTAKRRSAQETADDQFAVFQHVCPTGIALVGPEGTIVSVNKAGEAHAAFTTLRTGRGYGLQWRF
ncbi:hypothetical protein ACFQ1S_31255 [Kibdelosporangium lantanae]|uniref:PAS domain-containing protein n=1 Tax=Kibdelosporangium lantanae TaxID=1497396 RepID=A0ABW3MG23_9PSEU